MFSAQHGEVNLVNLKAKSGLEGGPIVLQKTPQHSDVNLVNLIQLEAKNGLEGGPIPSQQKLDASFASLLDLAKKGGFTPFLVWGSALHAVRDGTLKNDDDIDIAIHRDQVDNVKKEMKSMNMHFTTTPDHAGMVTTNLLSFQTYEFSNDGKYVCFTCDYPGCKYRNAFLASDMFPGKEIQISQHSLSFPISGKVQVPTDASGSSHEFFSAQYGQDWRTPKQHYKQNSVNERVQQKLFDKHCPARMIPSRT